MSVLALSDAERRRADDVDRLLRLRSPARLVPHLADSSWAIRRFVVAALAQLGDDAVSPLLEVLTGRRDDEVSLAAAIDALVASSGAVDEPILSLTRSETVAVVCDAVLILGRRQYGAAVPTLARLAEDANDNVALAAIEAVGRIGGQAGVALLVSAVKGRNFFRAFPAIGVLGRTGDPRAVGPLSELLNEAPYAIEAARALGHGRHPSAAPALAALVVQNDVALVRVAAVALAEIHDHHAAELGGNRSVVDALTGLDASAAARGLTAAVDGAEPSERAALCRVLGWVGGTEAVRAFIGLLDEDPAVSRDAASALAAMGSAAEPLISAALRESPGERRALLLPIFARGRSAPVDVVDCLRDPDASVRAVACETLAKIGDVDAVGPLFALIGDADARVSQAALGAIQSLGGEQSERLALLAARSPDARARRAALRILSYFGWPSALDVFLSALGDPDDRLRDLGASGLASIDDPRALGGLMTAADHLSPRTRAAAVRALGQSRGGELARERLLAALKDPEPWVRYYACQSLSRLKEAAAADAVALLLDDPAGQVRVAAIEALAGLRGERALEALHSALESTDPDMKRAALIGIGSVKSPSSFGLVRRAAVSGDGPTRWVALSALAEFEGREVIAGLAAALADPDERVRTAAVSLLGTRPGVEATAALVGGLADPSLRSRIVDALAAACPSGRIEGLLDALRTATGETASLVVSALAQMGRADSAIALHDAFAFGDPFARRAIATALVALDPPGGRDLLSRAAREDPDAQVREIAGAASRPRA